MSPNANYGFGVMMMYTYWFMSYKNVPFWCRMLIVAEALWGEREYAIFKTALKPYLH